MTELLVRGTIGLRTGLTLCSHGALTITQEFPTDKVKYPTLNLYSKHKFSTPLSSPSTINIIA